MTGRVCRRGSDGPTVLGKESYGLTPDGGQSVPGRGLSLPPARQLREAKAQRALWLWRG
jgi:hypothetical protein